MAEKVDRVFLDSNVIISGLISEKGAPRIILDILCLGLPFLTGITGRYNIIEIERNLAKKLSGVLPVYKKYLPELNLKILPLPSMEKIENFSKNVTDISGKDIPVLVSAIEGRADFLVTGDKKDFEKLKTGSSYSFKIVDPSEFLDVILPEILQDIKEDKG
jgi:putative PIN family toxin of toxin-antitoxin system